MAKKPTTLADPDMEFHPDLAEYRHMEKWLDEHPDFVHDYFARKASRSMVDGWLISHALSQSTTSPSGNAGMLHAEAGGGASSAGSSNSKHSSGANTPVRKISAQEFEKGGQILKPMVLTVDGQPTFLGTTSDSPTTTPKFVRKTRSELKALDERELMYELVFDICHDMDTTSLCHKILQNVGTLLNADRCSMFLVRGSKDSDKKVLVSSLFDVTIHSSLQDCKEKSEEIRVAWGTGIIGYVAKTGVAVNIPDAYEVSQYWMP
jgi:dual 3',5'-cyclic-AMP and -GMP phosphodiesterase 11